MIGYQGTGAGGTIGALLRQIQEEKSQGPLVATPDTQTGSPIRSLVQPSLSQVEAPDSSRLVSVRPELGGAEQGGQPVVPPFGGGEAGAEPGSVVAPLDMNAEQLQAQRAQSIPGPSGQAGSSEVPSDAPFPTPVPTPTPRPQSLATSVMPYIMPKATVTKSSVQSSSKTAQSKAPTPQVTPFPKAPPVPTPTIAINRPQNSPSQRRSGQPIVQDFIKSILAGTRELGTRISSSGKTLARR